MNEPTIRLPGQISTNTYVSVGLLVFLLGGFWAVLNTIYSSKTEITTRQDKMEMRIANIEAQKKQEETWTDTDMFRWAVHLQRDNADPKKLQVEGLKVPEPEVHK